tara:strand:- start:700 stop:981 length:282 start_codon:yes stop_codon:yes gene_type:complete
MKIQENSYGGKTFSMKFKNGWTLSVLDHGREKTMMAWDKNDRNLTFKDVSEEYETNARDYKSDEDIIKFLNMVSNFHDTLISYTILFSSDKEG